MDDRRDDLCEVFCDEDVVDRVFDYVRELLPDHAALADELEEIKRQVRREFGGREVYIHRRRTDEARERAERVLALFNGRNASEVARRLGIGRATVYRIIKQARK